MEKRIYFQKSIILYFVDGSNFHVSSKKGLCTYADNFEIGINNKDFIPRHRIIRIEIIEE